MTRIGARSKLRFGLHRGITTALAAVVPALLSSCGGAQRCPPYSKRRFDGERAGSAGTR